MYITITQAPRTVWPTTEAGEPFTGLTVWETTLCNLCPIIMSKFTILQQYLWRNWKVLSKKKKKKVTLKFNIFKALTRPLETFYWYHSLNTFFPQPQWRIYKFLFCQYLKVTSADQMHSNSNGFFKICSGTKINDDCWGGQRTFNFERTWKKNVCFFQYSTYWGKNSNNKH